MAGPEKDIDISEKEVMDRPPVIQGRIYKIVTAQCGNCYITIGHIGGEFTPDFRPIEIFATVGGSGDCAAAYLQAVTRTVSLALRAGVSIDKVIKSLTKVRCPMPFYGNTFLGKGQTLSCVNAVARVLKLEMEFTKPPEEVEPDESGDHPSSKSHKTK